MTSSALDLRVYLVTSGTGPQVPRVAAAAARGGAGVVQVRAKESSTRDLLELTLAVAQAVSSANPTTRVLVDDRADVAWAARQLGAAVHGVHLGQDDLAPHLARNLLGPDSVIGLTTGTQALVEAANQNARVLDYIGAGPFRPTPTKDSGRPPLGINGYPPLVAATKLPIVAIGDITPHDVPALAQTGIAGVAMVRSLMGAFDPEATVRSLLRIWERELQDRSHESAEGLPCLSRSLD